MKLEVIFTAFLFLSLAESSSISQSACKIVSEVLKKEFWMKTIAIVKFKNNFHDDVVEGLQKCLPMEISTLLIDMKSFNMITKAIHSPTMAVMIVDEMDEMEKGNFLSYLTVDFHEKPFLDHNSKFLILTSNHDTNFWERLVHYLKIVPIENYVILLKFGEEVLINLSNSSNVFVLSQNKDILNREIYQKLPRKYPNHIHYIFINAQIPRVLFINQTIYSKYDYFLKHVVAKIEGSMISYLFIKDESLIDLKLFNFLLDELTLKRQFEMTLNTFVEPTSAAPRLMTYEEVSQCIMVPKPKQAPKGKRMLLKPFDKMTWICYAISIIACTLIWRLGHHTTSYWFIPFFFWAFYHGQSVNFTSNRKIFVILLQTLVFMLFILGNAYQGVITSFMMAPEVPQKIKSIENLIENGQKFLISQRMNLILNQSEKYRNALKNGIVQNADRKYDLITFPELYKDNRAVILDCDQAQFNIETGIASDFYIVEEKLFPFFVRLQVIFLSRFLKQWQLLMDWSFEAGLMQAWQEFVYLSLNLKRPKKMQLIRLDELSVIFSIIIFLLIISVGVFCCEVFWGNIGEPYLRVRKTRNENLSLKEIQRRKFDFLRLKSKEGKVRVRRIQVQRLTKIMS